MWYAKAKLKIMIDDRNDPGGGGSRFSLSSSWTLRLVLTTVSGMMIGDVYAASTEENDEAAAGAAGSPDDGDKGVWSLDVDDDKVYGDAGLSSTRSAAN